MIIVANIISKKRANGKNIDIDHRQLNKLLYNYHMNKREQSAFVIHTWYKENARLFGSQLLRPSLKIQDLAAFGEYSGLWHFDKNKRETISLNPKYLKNKKWLRITLVHEMIHQLQAIQKSPRTVAEQHGRFFQQQVCRIIALDKSLMQLIITVPKWASHEPA
jgi:SprT-like family